MAKLVRLCAYLMLGAKDVSLHKNFVSNVRYPVVARCGNLGPREYYPWSRQITLGTRILYMKSDHSNDALGMV